MEHDEFSMTVLGAQPNRSHGLGRSNVVPRPQIRNVEEMKDLGEVFGRSSERKPSAHFWVLIGARSGEFYHGSTSARTIPSSGEFAAVDADDGLDPHFIHLGRLGWHRPTSSVPEHDRRG